MFAKKCNNYNILVGKTANLNQNLSSKSWLKATKQQYFAYD